MKYYKKGYYVNKQVRHDKICVPSWFVIWPKLMYPLDSKYFNNFLGRMLQIFKYSSRFFIMMDVFFFKCCLWNIRNLLWCMGRCFQFHHMGYVPVWNSILVYMNLVGYTIFMFNVLSWSYFLFKDGCKHTWFYLALVYMHMHVYTYCNFAFFGVNKIAVFLERNICIKYNK